MARTKLKLKSIANNTTGNLPGGITIPEASMPTVRSLSSAVTVGSAGAEDTKLVFDGNAQDFHIGLDDSEDKLTIGLGSTLGTTSHMTFDSTGAILKPLQPAFLAFATTVSNLPIDITHTVEFGTEVYDQNGDFSSDTFTAPITGRYLLTANFYSNTIVNNANYFWFYIQTSNRTYSSIVDPGTFDENSSYHNLHVSAVADMDASDTAKVRYVQNGGSASSDLGGGTFFSGCLLA
tara:strand:- start:194 stop:898 length:705 start_codon:yes stop_codon:yes gene_type:complete